MSELQKKNDAELAVFVAEKREELRNLRFGGAGSGMRNTHTMKNIRREIARGLTELHKRARIGA